MAKTAPVNLEKRFNSIPILYTEGTYYEVGYDVGRTFRGLIQDFLSNFKVLHETFLPAYETPDGKAAYEITLRSLQANYPHYVRELQGTADGARVPFFHLMLLHMDQIIGRNSGKQRQSSFGCSSFCCVNEQQVILGHTEDALPETLNHLYIVSAHIKEDSPQGRWQTKSEGFTALCYAGHLPGFCMGYNHHGLVYSINVIFPKEVIPGKTPRHFLTRALLSADTMVQAQGILRDTGVGSADGFSVNMSFSCQEGDHLFHNFEVGPAMNVDESPLSVLTISPGEYHVHTNRYLRLTIPEDLDIEGASSTHRLERASKFYPIESKESIVSLLSDKEDKEYPIYREGTDKESITTVAVGMFDILQREWSIWIKKPCSSDPLITLPMIFKWNTN